MSALATSELHAMASRRGMAVTDWPLLLCAGTLLTLGLVMIASASIGIADRQLGSPFYYFDRQLVFVTVGLCAAYLVWQVPLTVIERLGPMLMVFAAVLLAVVFIPGLGRTVNGSTRWLALGPVNFQASELMKLALIAYLSGYLVRRGEEVRSTVGGFLKPMLLVLLLVVLLLGEPDFGAAVVLIATALGMMFLGGVRLWLFGVLVTMAVGGLGLLAVSAPYRMHRLTGFLNPWADPFNSGFQLTQSLIAFGRGGWFGVGLGGSVQKLFYLPEAHTDFVFAVLGEELGLIGVTAVILLYGFLIWRLFRLGRRALDYGMEFGGYFTYGLGLWISLQAVINMGVNMGLLPTKGLTLPLMSYGGSSVALLCVAFAVVLRVDREWREAMLGLREGGAK